MKKEYEAILHAEPPVSLKHRPMSLLNRAAQFAPFAALTGYGESIEEAARYTDERREMTEEELDELNRLFRSLQEREKERPMIRVTRFVEDERKSGGSYRTFTGKLRRVDVAERILYFESGERICMEDVTEAAETEEEMP